MLLVKILESKLWRVHDEFVQCDLETNSEIPHLYITQLPRDSAIRIPDMCRGETSPIQMPWKRRIDFWQKARDNTAITILMELELCLTLGNPGSRLLPPLHSHTIMSTNEHCSPLSTATFWSIKIRMREDPIARNLMLTASLCNHEFEAFKGTRYRLVVLSDSG